VCETKKKKKEKKEKKGADVSFANFLVGEKMRERDVMSEVNRNHRGLFLLPPLSQVRKKAISEPEGEGEGEGEGRTAKQELIKSARIQLRRPAAARGRRARGEAGNELLGS